MIATLKCIARDGAQSYIVVLEEAGGKTRAFTLEVEEGEIQLVKWHDDFAAYMGQNLGPASPLLEAVLTFHRVGVVRV